MTFASWSTVRSRESVQIIRFVLQVLLPAEYLTCFRLNFLKNPVNEQEKWLSQSLVCHPGLRAWVQIPHTHVESEVAVYAYGLSITQAKTGGFLELRSSYSAKLINSGSSKGSCLEI